MVNFRKLALYGALGFFGLLLVAAIAVPLAFRNYLHSQAFRTKIGEAAGKALKAEAEVMPPHLSGTTAYTDGFTAHGSPAAAFREVRADQIRADFNWRGLLHRKWQIDELAVERLDVQLAERQPPGENEEKREFSTMPREPAGPKWQLDLRKVNVSDSRWRWGGGTTPAGELSHAALNVVPSDQAWLINVSGGRLLQTGWPEIGLESAHLRYGAGTLFVTESRLQQGSGVARVTGEIEIGKRLEMQVALEGLDVTPLLAGDWRARLTGKISGDGTVRAPLGGAGADNLTVEGSARLLGGQLTGFPVLDEIAIFTRTARFRTLGLTTASLDFTRDARSFTGKNVIAEAEGLMRIEGNFVVADGRIDGTFQVGVTAASLQWLPGSQTRVFITMRNGYYWAPMRLTGPVEHPAEDLTPRLAQAVAGEVLDGAETTVKGAAKVLKDTAKGLLDNLLR